MKWIDGAVPCSLPALIIFALRRAAVLIYWHGNVVDRGRSGRGFRVVHTPTCRQSFVPPFISAWLQLAIWRCMTIIPLVYSLMETWTYGLWTRTHAPWELGTSSLHVQSRPPPTLFISHMPHAMGPLLNMIQINLKKKPSVVSTFPWPSGVLIKNHASLCWPKVRRLNLQRE